MKQTTTLFTTYPESKKLYYALARATWALLEKFQDQIPGGRLLVQYMKAFMTRYKDFLLIPEDEYVDKENCYAHPVTYYYKTNCLVEWAVLFLVLSK